MYPVLQNLNLFGCELASSPLLVRALSGQESEMGRPTPVVSQSCFLWLDNQKLTHIHSHVQTTIHTRFVCSDLIACDIKHARMGLHDIYITASNEKFRVHPIPPLLSSRFFFFSKSNTKHGNIKQLIIQPTCCNINFSVSLFIGTWFHQIQRFYKNEKWNL